MQQKLFYIFYSLIDLNKCINLNEEWMELSKIEFAFFKFLL